MPNFRRGIHKSDKKADSEMKTQSQQEKYMYLRTPIKRIPIEGYVTIRNVLSDHTAILFAVPSHVWNELEKSKEWTDFQNLLEKYQESFARQLHIEAGHKQENYPHEDVKQAFAGFSRQTEKESRRSKRTNYQDMTESEKNEIIAYAAGTLQSIHKEINNVQLFLLITSVAKICILLAILIAILLHK